MKIKYIVTVIAITVAIITVINVTHGDKSNAHHIANKLSENRPKSKYKPVLIFAFSTELEGKDGGRANGKFVGSGSAFESEGRMYIITAEHLFGIDEKDYCYGFTYLDSKLAMQNPTIQTIEGVVSRGEDINKDNKPVDAALLVVGPPKPIPSFSGFGARDKGVKTTIELDVQKLSTPHTVYSLVDGSRCAIIAKASMYDATGYCLIAHEESMPGESGSGFITESGEILVLVGTAGTTTKEHEKLLRDNYGDFTNLAIVYGPMKPLE